MFTYKVKKGDSLWLIAEKQLGDGNRYREIMTINGLHTTTIEPNQVLKLPPKKVASVSDTHYEKLGKLFETAIQDISELSSVKSLLKELEG